MYSLQQQLSKRTETIPRAHAKDPVRHLCLDQHRQNHQRWYCLFGLWLRCSRWWNQAYSEVAEGACCKREEGINKVHGLLNKSKSSTTNQKIRSVGILLEGSESQEDTSLNFEGYWTPKNPGGIAIKIKISTSWTENTGIRRAALNSRIEQSTVFVFKNPASQQDDWHALLW